MSAYRLTIRHKSKVKHEKFGDLQSALDAARGHAEWIRAEGDLPGINSIRDFSSGDRVHGRIEISCPGLRARDGGIDVMGNGALVAYAGFIGKRKLEPGPDEDIYDALRTTLER